MSKAKEIIEELYKDLFSLYELWEKKSSNVYAARILEHDALLIGCYFGTVDPLGKYAEFNLLAECIAIIRMIDSPVKNDMLMESYVETIVAELNDKAANYKLSDPASDIADLISKMQIVEMIDDLKDNDELPSGHIKKIKTMLVEMANMFVVCDGMITDKELVAINQFEDIMING